jgi:hypothetical protein
MFKFYFSFLFKGEEKTAQGLGVQSTGTHFSSGADMELTRVAKESDDLGYSYVKGTVSRDK